MGKVLSISYEGRELTRVSLTKRTLTIGRSPICDVTVRAPGVKAVHYVLDWAAVGEFDPRIDKQEWSLMDVSAEESDSQKVKNSLTGMGRMFGEKPLVEESLTFRILDDRLHQSVLEGGSFHDSLARMKNTSNSGTVTGQKPLLLEIIRVAEDTGTVTEVIHIEKTSKTSQAFFPLRNLPTLEVSWLSDDAVGFKYGGPPEKVVATQWRGTRLETINHRNEFKLQPWTFIQLELADNEYYFRLVPKIEVPIVPAAWKGDRFLWFFLFMLLLGFWGLHTISNMPRPIDLDPLKEPPRVAKIELPPPPPPPPQPPPEPVQETAAPIEKPKPPEPPKEHAKPKPVTPPKKEVVEEAPKETIRHTKEVASKHKDEPKKNEPIRSNLNAAAPVKAKPKTHLEAPAPEKPVGQVGLLGSLKSMKGRPSEVKASDVMNSVVTKTISADDGNVVVKQPPAGVLSSRNNSAGQGGRDSAGLMAATRKVGGSDSINANSIAGLSGAGQKGLDVSFGDSDYAGGGRDHLGSGGDGESESVEGGLDKESVRRTLALYRRDIRTCYEKALNVSKAVRGRIVYNWLISASGPTVWVKMIKSGADFPKLESCVQNVIQKIMWPKAANKKETIVIYPFQFQSKE